MVFGLIFEASPPPSEQLMMLGTEERAGLMDRCCSVLDVLSFNHRSNTAFILMPPTTRKNSDEKEKVIVFVDPFDSFLISDFIPPSWCTSTNQPGQKSAEVMPEENIVTPQAWLKNVVQRCKLDSLKLSLNEDNQKLFITQSLETEDRYVIKMITNCPQIQKSASNSSSSCKEDRYELVVEFDGCVNTPSIAVPSALKMEVVYTSLNTKSHTSRKWTDIGRLSLRVPYPVSTYKYDWKRIKTKGEKGDIVQLTLYKCGVWTIDKTMMTPLDISSLDPLGSSQNAVGELNKHLSQMFTVEENKSRCFGMENTKVLPKSAMFDVRETIQILFVNTLQKVRSLLLKEQYIGSYVT